MARGAPSVTHIFFANDSLLFFKAIYSEVLEVKRCFDWYEAASSKTINFHKSSITFSTNNVGEDRDTISSFFGVE